MKQKDYARGFGRGIPAILGSTASIISGTAALVAVVLTFRGKSLIMVALSSSAAVLMRDWVMGMMR